MGKIARKSQDSDYGDCRIKQLPWIDNISVKIIKSTYTAAQSVKNRGHFLSDAAATKLIFLALRDITKKWGKPADHLEVSGNPTGRTILCDSNLKIMQCLPTAEKLGILKVQLQEPMNLGLCSHPSSGETIAGVVLNLAS